MSFSTVFQSYHDDEQIMNVSMCNGTPGTIEKMPALEMEPYLQSASSRAQTQDS